MHGSLLGVLRTSMRSCICSNLHKLPMMSTSFSHQQVVVMCGDVMQCSSNNGLWVWLLCFSVFICRKFVSSFEHFVKFNALFSCYVNSLVSCLLLVYNPVRSKYRRIADTDTYESLFPSLKKSINNSKFLIIRKDMAQENAHSKPDCKKLALSRVHLLICDWFS